MPMHWPNAPIGHDVFGEGRIAQPIAAAIQADNKAITDQIIAPHPVKIYQILDPHRISRSRNCPKDQGEQSQSQTPHMKFTKESWDIRTVTE